MNSIPAPSPVLPREEWPDADFDLPDDLALDAHCHKSDNDNDDDWLLEIDSGKAGGSKVIATTPIVAQHDTSRTFTIRPPIPQHDTQIGIDDDDADEGLSTIKASAFSKGIFKPAASTPLVDEDMEASFALPSDLTCLSLAPLSLNHRSSKSSLEWGDKDHTSSSQSSDAYSSLGFADASSSSNSTSSVSMPNSETDKDEDEDDSELDGLTLPSALFESCHGARKLNQILEMKKKGQTADDGPKLATPDPEDDFETGLVIDDSADLSSSRLLTAQHHQSQRSPMSRSYSMPPRPTLSPPLRLRGERAKSPSHPPPSSTRQLSKLRLSPSPPLQGITRSHVFQTPPSAPSTSSAASFLSPKSGSLRGQKSHTGLKPPTSHSSVPRLPRKASLSSLMDPAHSPASGSGSGAEPSRLARYVAPTMASRAKSQKPSSMGRISALEYTVPPTRPCTPSSNPSALRLTMPTSSRLKSRPSLASVFSPLSAASSSSRLGSPLPPRPPSAAATRAHVSSPLNNPPLAPRILRRPKRQRTYGDGTELDAIDDLPTDREKEGRYRVHPKGHGNRVPGGSYSSKLSDKGTVQRKGKPSIGATELTVFAHSANTPELTEHIEVTPGPETLAKRKKNPSSFRRGQTKRKPTLIRNLGGAGAPKIVGSMKWNPRTLRWEGNDHILRDFDAVTGTSTRPALITHLTGSSIGSPITSFASGTRIVGNMIFDPARMCWISTLPPEEDEPDVFANLADDEEDVGGWESKGGTIRARQQQVTPSSSDTSLSSTSVEAPSLVNAHTRALSESGIDRGSRVSIVNNVDDAFLRSCRVAEERHRLEMKSWCPTPTDAFVPPVYLYEIRALAMRKY